MKAPWEKGQPGIGPKNVPESPQDRWEKWVRSKGGDAANDLATLPEDKKTELYDLFMQCVAETTP